jgi:hypothetical protein
MTRTTKQKIVSGVITFILVIGLHIFLLLANIPTRDFTEIYEKLDDTVWTQFLPKKIKEEKLEMKKKTPEKSVQPKVEAEKTVEATPAPVQREKFDPNEFAERLKLGRMQRTIQNPDDPTQKDLDTNPHIQAARRSQLNRTRFRLLEGSAGRLPALPKQTGAPANATIQAGQGKAVDKSRAQIQGKGTLPDVPQNLAANPSVPTLALKDFDRDKIEVSEIFKALIEWMKRHPVALPPVIKQFMTYRDGGLTSRVDFKISRRSFEMFLLCFEGNYEVRIALVEKNAVTYLIDQGFTKESQKLRAGTVSRLPGSSNIATLETQPLPIGHKKNKEFYDIFLSWWETVKHEVER